MHGSGLELTLVFLLAAVIAVPVFKRLGIGAVLAYLVAGVVLGPDGMALVRDADRVLDAAEIGVVMMLFVIGLELSPSRLRVMRKPVFGAGGLQVLLTAPMPSRLNTGTAMTAASRNTNVRSRPLPCMHSPRGRRTLCRQPPRPGPAAAIEAGHHPR